MKNAPEGAFLLGAWRKRSPTHPNPVNSSKLHLALQTLENTYPCLYSTPVRPSKIQQVLEGK